MIIIESFLNCQANAGLFNSPKKKLNQLSGLLTIIYHDFESVHYEVCSL